MPTTASPPASRDRRAALRMLTAFAAGPTIVVLAGCTDYGTREFGIRRGQQEQTRITSPPPLSMPPILTQDPAGSGGQTADARASSGASEAGRAPREAAPVASSRGEAALLDESGPSANADIRDKVDHDAQLGRADPALSDSLLFGATRQQPIIQRGSKSWWDRIF